MCFFSLDDNFQVPSFHTLGLESIKEALHILNKLKYGAPFCF